MWGTGARDDFSIPSIFANISNPNDCSFFANTIEICDFVEGKMIPCKNERREEEISKLVQHSPKIISTKKKLFVKDSNSANELVYLPWDGNIVNAKHEDYALGINSALLYLGKEYSYYDIFGSEIIGNYRIKCSPLRIYLMEELNRLKNIKNS